MSFPSDTSSAANMYYFHYTLTGIHTYCTSHSYEQFTSFLFTYIPFHYSCGSSCQAGCPRSIVSVTIIHIATHMGLGKRLCPSHGKRITWNTQRCTVSLLLILFSPYISFKHLLETIAEYIAMLSPERVYSASLLISATVSW